MNDIYSILLMRLSKTITSHNRIIPWATPVPVFGDSVRSKVATLGLNPSNREFVDTKGNELQGEYRRFHTLNSLMLDDWSKVNKSHLNLIEKSCEEYFYNNPYDNWFAALNKLISGTGCSYYNSLFGKACHLDLVPYATSVKWSSLTSTQKKNLLELSSDALVELLNNSSIKLLILNGSTVVKSFQDIFNIELNIKKEDEWTLPRDKGKGVTGFSFYGKIDHLSNINLNREIVVIGFNHNIQSSFGVTNNIKLSIQNWITGISNGIEL
ncbi:hypothetical protein [Marinobacterium sedimentorum]|uniref:hypothetical protein n=1 Tax=Marinobacterium sedimentorum TaxID=2927804 RepID=UPI0020C6CE86|nr:hypothetical protein [Marinobacterium sedimentorum]MCP8687284.1 hypothetical protein [Marinobacterium sedimentorum]